MLLFKQALHFLQQEAEQFIMEEIAKQQKDKLPEFAIKTQLLTRKAEEKERLDKVKEQMHFKQLLQSKREEDDQGHEKSKGATEGTVKPVVSDLSCNTVALKLYKHLCSYLTTSYVASCGSVNFVQRDATINNLTSNTRYDVFNVVERQVER